MGSYILVILLIALVGVLFAGVFLMGAGGETNKKYSNKLMMARVTLHGLILLMLMIVLGTS